MELPSTRDERPKKGGWAPGWYSTTCWTCKIKMLSDKRAMMCADCAYDTDPNTSNAPKTDIEKGIRDINK